MADIPALRLPSSSIQQPSRSTAGFAAKARPLHSQKQIRRVHHDETDQTLQAVSGEVGQDSCVEVGRTFAQQA